MAEREVPGEDQPAADPARPPVGHRGAALVMHNATIASSGRGHAGWPTRLLAMMVVFAVIAAVLIVLKIACATSDADPPHPPPRLGREDDLLEYLLLGDPCARAWSPICFSSSGVARTRHAATALMP